MRWRWVLVVTIVATGLVVVPAATGGDDVDAAVSGAVAVSESGSNHWCGIHADGTLSCWGYNFTGEATPPAGTFRSVDAGLEHTCGVHTDNTLDCWGRDADGQASPPTGTFEAVVAAARHSCGLRTSGEISCWGAQPYGELDAPPGTDFVSISSNHDHTCAVRSDGSAECWGSDAGQATFVPDGTYEQVSAGRNQTCGIRTGGALVCWGDETQGSLLDVPAGRYVDVALYVGSACAVRVDGALLCWGSNGDGVLDAPTGRFVDVAVGSSGACAVSESGDVRCWGGEYFFVQPPTTAYDGVRLGRFADSPCLLRPDGLWRCGPDRHGDWVDPATVLKYERGYQATCTLLVDGSLSCDGTLVFGDLPVPAGDYVDVALGLEFGCALQRGGGVVCWGQTSPPAPSGTFTAIDVGDDSMCALASDGSVSCTSTGLGLDPLPPAPDEEFASIALAAQSACGVLVDHTIECWGTTIDGAAVVPPAGQFRSLDSGSDGYCAIELVTDAIECWAFPVFMEGPSSEPPAGEFDHLSLGAELGCGIRLDGVLQCWGTTSVHGEPFAAEAVPPWPSVRAQPPVRILDTRSHATNPSFPGEPHPGLAGNTIGLGLQNSAPANRSSVVLSVTVVSPQEPGFITVWPCDEDRPLASSVNYERLDIVTNSVVVGVDGPEDRVCLMPSSSTDLVVDVIGYVPNRGSLATVVPARLADTRSGEPTVDGVSQGEGRLLAGATLAFEVAGRGGVDDDAEAAVLNVISVFPDGPGFLTVYACDDPLPLASNVNYVAGVTTNMAFTPIGADGRVCVYSSAATDVVVDVNAFVPDGYAPIGIAPARLADTRSGEPTIDGLAAGTGRQPAGSTMALDVTGRGGVPDDATTVLVNAAVVSPAAAGFLTMYPCGSPFPLASVMTYAPGDVRAVAAPVKVGPDGTICIFSLAATDLVVDVSGFVADD